MSLSLLLDYRQEDSKEHSFEVSLFAELFNEMLIRDFGFNIYKALYELPEKPKEEKKDKDEKKDKEKEEKEKKDDKKQEEKKKTDVVDEKKTDEKKSDDEQHHNKIDQEISEEVEKIKEDDKKDKREGEKEKKEQHKDEKQHEETDDDEDDDRDKKKDRKGSKKDKKDKIKLYTKDKHLLLSFVYFDQTHCGYIFDKDIEDLLFTLGLKLSRAQIRKLVGKVIVRDSLHYRKLTDKPKDDELIVVDDSEKEADWQKLAIGNKKYLPIFKRKEAGETNNTNRGSTNLQEGKSLLLIIFFIFIQCFFNAK